MRRTLPFVLIGFLARLVAAQTPADAEIARVLADRIDTQKQSVGIVAGVIDDAGRRVVAHGRTAVQGDRPVDGDTIFEIGSVTKVFTALLLADMVQKGELALTDPITKYLPATVKVPARGGNVITLEHLATHTSGLPRLPSHLAPQDPANPYSSYTPADLYAFLSSHVLTRDIGSRYDYSNLGAGLLGHILALRAKTDYETLLRTRIFEPLGMKSTTITLQAPMRARLALGHDPAL